MSLTAFIFFLLALAYLGWNATDWHFIEWLLAVIGIGFVLESVNEKN
jgi:hypothetical protein